MNYEEFMKYVDKMDNNIRKKLKDNEEELTFYSQLVISFNETCNKNQKQKEVINKAMEYINKNLIVVSILDGVKTFGLNSYTFDYKKLLDILNEVSE